MLCDDVGRPFKVSELGWKFRAVTKRAGLGTDVHPHTLRHAYASLALKADVPVTTVSANLGHSSSATTDERLRAPYTVFRGRGRKSHGASLRRRIVSSKRSPSE